MAIYAGSGADWLYFTCLWQFNFSVALSFKAFTNPTETSKPWTGEEYQA